MLANFESLNSNSRIWIYQTNRALNASEETKALEMLDAFLSQWAAHGKQLQASGQILHRHFLVIATDQAFQMASGCSIDSSVHFVQELGEALNVSFFERTNLAFLKEGEVVLVKMNELKAEIEKGNILPNDLFFDNTVSEKSQIDSTWLKKASESWLSRYFKTAANV